MYPPSNEGPDPKQHLDATQCKGDGSYIGNLYTVRRARFVPPHFSVIVH